VVWRRQQHGGVGADAQKRGLAKTHQPCGAHQQFQAQGKHRINHDLGDQVDAEVARHQRVGRQRQEGQAHEDGLGSDVGLHG